MLYLLIEVTHAAAMFKGVAPTSVVAWFKSAFSEQSNLTVSWCPSCAAIERGVAWLEAFPLLILALD
eukprot:m.26155 g.26155  ORF g.26155 m.26155 type:complete len:67 (-) comp7772_c0_seq2:458-658(-)